MSGGARVALWAALDTRGLAGVIASSAGYPDGKPRKSLAFPIFATAGTEDFNHLEMRQLDETLTSPHHLAIFEGGHVWLSSDLAVEAVEWMEVQAMKTGRRPRDEEEIDQIFSKRVEAARRAAGDKDTLLALRSIASDFEGLKDVTSDRRDEEPAVPAGRLGDRSRRDERPGVDTLHVWAFPATGGAASFLGVANTGGVRGDVGAIFGSQFTNSGYNVVVNGLAPGQYQIVVYAHSTVTGTFSQLRVVTVTVK